MRARTLAPILGDDAELLEAAAWLHDIGYSPYVADTGFHPLDGARYLRDVQHADGTVCRLVAHHTGAMIEADERGLADVLASEFEPASQYLVNALIYCDITTSPDGKEVTADQRLAEIQYRYGEGRLVRRSIRRATPQLLCAVRTIEDMTRAYGRRHMASAWERFLVGGHHDLPAGGHEDGPIVIPTERERVPVPPAALSRRPADYRHS